MAACGKFDMPSGSADRPLHDKHRPSRAFDRSGSFNKKTGNLTHSALSSMSRCDSAATRADVLNFFKCLRFDPKLMAADYQLNRQVGFKQLMTVAIGLPSDNSTSGPSKDKLLPSPSLEELKRLKASLRKSSIKSRERVKIFTESFSVMDKYFPSIFSRKRSRLDGCSTDKCNALLPSDQPVSASGSDKMGTQSQAVASGFEPALKNPEERTKNAIANKRIRTSMADFRTDARPNTPTRSSGNLGSNREVSKLPNSGAAQAQGRTLSIGVGGWEKSNMKKKRSRLKQNVSPNRVEIRHIDCYGRKKRGMKPKLLTDARSWLNDTHGFRQGLANGAAKVDKEDGTNQSSSLGMRSSVPKADHDKSSLSHDRRDHLATSEKERVNLRAVNKGDLRSASPASNTKVNVTTRALRSGSNVLQKLPPDQQTIVANDWELSHCKRKPFAAGGASKRKCTSSTQSSSPPVVHYIQKITHNARKTNFVPIVSSNDGTPHLNTTTDIGGNENGTGITGQLSSNSSLQFKSNSDYFFKDGLSECEKSGPADIKSRDKDKKTDEMNEKTSQNIPKVSTLKLPTRKIKLFSQVDQGDGVRRQGRNGGGFTSTRSHMSMMVEKLGNVGTEKQLRSARLGIPRTVRKPGRLPSQELSDCKAYAHQKYTKINEVADIHVGSHDGFLLAAAVAAVNTACCLSSSFWRQMEQYFSFISDVDIACLKQQLESTAPVPTPVPQDADSFSTMPNDSGLTECERDSTDIKTFEPVPQHSIPAKSEEISLCQRLISALITDEENEELPYSGNDDEFDNDIMSMTENLVSPNPNYSQIGVLPDQAIMPDVAVSELQYENMSLNERILLEMETIGLFPEPVLGLQTGDEEITKNINSLEDKYQEQVIRKKALLSELSSSAAKMREFEEKKFQHRALDKLVTIAYVDYMTCEGPHALEERSANSNIAKEAALTFAKETLKRYQRFEETGNSCYSDPLFMDMYLSGYSLNDAQTEDANGASESGDQYADASAGSLQVGVSAPMDTQESHVSSLNALGNPDAIDLSHLQIPGMDGLGVHDNLGGQGQDLGSWLNIDDDILEDHEDTIMGLAIPMDDLTDLNLVL